MIDNRYLDKLKEEDYIAWDDLVNDPMMIGNSSNCSGFVLLFATILIVGMVVISLW